jgi:hypothetical protein
VSFSRIRETLRFHPQWTLEGGVDQVLQAIRNGKVIDYRDARYSNVKFLSEDDGMKLLPVQNGWAKDMVDAWDRQQPAGPRADIQLGETLAAQ